MSSNMLISIIYGRKNVMKAKTYFATLKEAKSNEDLEQKIAEMLQDLCKEAEELIKQRCCKTEAAIASVINEVNTKYTRICELQASFRNEPENMVHPLAGIQLHQDGFKAAMVHLNKKYSFYFDLESHRHKMEKAQANIPKIVPVPLTPLKDLKKEDLSEEFLKNLYLLGTYSKAFPLEVLRPLAKRIEIIKKWIDQGYIDLSDIKEN